MTTTKAQRQARLAAAKKLIAQHGGQRQIDALSHDEAMPIHDQMARELQQQFASERMKLQTARGYIQKALRRLRGEIVKERRGGSRGGGLPKGSRKCQNPECGKWHVAVAPNGESWQCNECGTVHLPRKQFLAPGETFPLNQSLDDAVQYGVEYVKK